MAPKAETDLATLAAKAEAAAGPDRELDAEIALYRVRPDWRRLKDWKRTNGWFKPNCATDAWAYYTHDGLGGHARLPPVTESIDEALKLIKGPEEYPAHKTYLIDCATQTSQFAQPVAYVWSDTGKHMGKARTAPLALCAAALRALMSPS